jgi:tetratricopeptide (TPR) repeat protein
MGAFAQARAHLEQTLSICATDGEMIAAYRRFGTDDQVRASSFLASTLLLLGYPDQSAAMAMQAVARARAMGLPFTTALALSHVAFLGLLGGDPGAAASYADETLACSMEHRLAIPEYESRFTQGALLAQSGNPQRGIELMRKAMAAAESSAAHCRRSMHLGHVAAAHANLGQPEVGLDVLDEAMRMAEASNERFFEAELYRLRGKMLLALNREDEAEVELRRALSIAEQQQAHWWELRAAATLAQHWRDAGKYLEAYSLLRPIYGLFIEGLATQSLQDAKVLLDGLEVYQARELKPGGVNRGNHIAAHGHDPA